MKAIPSTTFFLTRLRVRGVAFAILDFSILYILMNDKRYQRLIGLRGPLRVRALVLVR